MILKDSVSTATGLEGKSYKIDERNIAKIISQVTENIAANKPAYVIREIVSNAYDATIRAGKDIKDYPIEIVLTRDYLTITDLGTGMDQKDIDELYTSIGASDKTKIVNEYGTHGLGSKSPFAVSDTFNVRSTKNGVERLWMMYKDGVEKKCTLLKEEKGSVNGTTVEIPIENFNRWHDEIEDTLGYFKGLVVRSPLTYDNVIHDFGLFRISSANYNRQAILIQEIPYSYEFKIQLPFCPVFHLHEGFEPTISRESFNLTDEIKELIYSRVQDCLRYILELTKDVDVLTYRFKDVEINGVYLGINYRELESICRSYKVDYKQPYLLNEFVTYTKLFGRLNKIYKLDGTRLTKPFVQYLNQNNIGYLELINLGDLHNKDKQTPEKTDFLKVYNEIPSLKEVVREYRQSKGIVYTKREKVKGEYPIYTLRYEEIVKSSVSSIELSETKRTVILCSEKPPFMMRGVKYIHVNKTQMNDLVKEGYMTFEEHSKLKKVRKKMLIAAGYELAAKGKMNDVIRLSDIAESSYFLKKTLFRRDLEKFVDDYEEIKRTYSGTNIMKLEATPIKTELIDKALRLNKKLQRIEKKCVDRHSYLTIETKGYIIQTTLLLEHYRKRLSK